MTHLAPLIRDLAVILLVAAPVAWLFLRLRLPLVLGYLVAGMAVGAPADAESIQTWADLGIVFVLFCTGLEFSFRRLLRSGSMPMVIALGEVAGSFWAAFWIARMLGWSHTQALYWGGCCSISSTTLILKTLHGFRLSHQRFARLIVSVLIVEDLLAILMIVGFSAAAMSRGESLLGFDGLAALTRLVLTVGTWVVVGMFVVPGAMRRIGRTGGDELLVLASVGLCLGLVALAAKLGYSIALGAFVMGSVIAETQDAKRLEGLLRPTRDLFAAVFFVSVGMSLTPSEFGRLLPMGAALAISVIAAKWFFTLIASWFAGAPTRNGILMGAGLGQIGEFSLILVSIGRAAGLLGRDFFSLCVTTSIMTALLGPLLLKLLESRVERVEAAIPRAWNAHLELHRKNLEAIRRRVIEVPGLKRSLGLWAINGLLVSELFTALGAASAHHRVLAPVALGVSFILASPLIWGMLHSTRKIPFLQAVTGLWVTVLALEFALPRTWLLSIAGGALVCFLLFYRRFGLTYAWLERKFSASLAPESSGEVDELLPWESQLERVRVTRYASLAGKSLAESQIREKYGVTMLAVDRASGTRVAPPPDTRLLPEDEWLVLGEREGVDELRAELESTQVSVGEGPALGDYHLQRLSLKPGGPLEGWIGKTVRDTPLREEWSAMLVGIENRGKRQLNPSPDQELKSGDVLWVVMPASQGPTSR